MRKQDMGWEGSKVAVGPCAHALLHAVPRCMLYRPTEWRLNWKCKLQAAGRHARCTGGRAGLHDVCTIADGTLLWTARGPRATWSSEGQWLLRMMWAAGIVQSGGQLGHWDSRARCPLRRFCQLESAREHSTLSGAHRCLHSHRHEVGHRLSAPQRSLHGASQSQQPAEATLELAADACWPGTAQKAAHPILQLTQHVTKGRVVLEGPEAGVLDAPVIQLQRPTEVSSGACYSTACSRQRPGQHKPRTRVSRELPNDSCS